jgi:hypothetical protein
MEDTPRFVVGQRVRVKYDAAVYEGLRGRIGEVEEAYIALSGPRCIVRLVGGGRPNVPESFLEEVEG